MPLGVEIEEPTWNQIASPSKYDNKLISTLKLIVHAVLARPAEMKNRFITVTHLYNTKIVKISFYRFWHK